MQLCQMLVQGMWVNESPLLQILDRPTVAILNEQYNVKNINDFIGMEEEDRTKALKGKDITKIASACNRIPTVSLTSKLGQV